MIAAKSENRLSIIIPAKNEDSIIGEVVAAVRRLYENAEIVVVDDGSDDDTGRAAAEAWRASFMIS